CVNYVREFAGDVSAGDLESAGDGARSDRGNGRRIAWNDGDTFLYATGVDLVCAGGNDYYFRRGIGCEHDASAECTRTRFSKWHGGFDMSFDTNAANKQPGLVRGLGPWAAAAIVVGTMIGTGIFIKPANMAQEAGTVGLVTLAWVIGGVLSLFGALCAAELGAAIPEAGGTYAYMSRAFGPVWGYLFGWTYSIIGAPTSIATIASGLLVFASFLFPVVTTPSWAQPLAVVAIALVTLINYFGVKLGGRVQVVLTVIKIAAVIAVIFIGFFL